MNHGTLAAILATGLVATAAWAGETVTEHETCEALHEGGDHPAPE
jgi:hypothetical protein